MSKQEKMKISEKEGRKIPASVFLWLLLILAMIIVFLVIQAEFRESNTLGISESKASSYQGVSQENKDDFLFGYFDVRKWP